MQHFHSHQHKLSKTIHIIPLIRLAMKYSQYPHLHHQWDMTRQHNTRNYMTRWLTLSKNDNKNTSGNDKVRIKSPYFLQKSYFIWQNNTKVLIVQYMSNMCSIPKKTLMFSWSSMTCLKVRGWIRSPVFLQGLEFIWHLCAQDVEDTPDMMMASSSIVQSTSPITPYLIWLITTYHSSHMTHHYSWLSQMTYHQ